MCMCLQALETLRQHLLLVKWTSLSGQGFLQYNSRRGLELSEEVSGY
jgi:hypothetical protein